MVALRFIVNIEPNKQNFIQFRAPGAFAASTDTLTLSPRTQWQTVLPVCSGWRWQTDEFPHLYALGFFWAILDEFRGHWKVNPDRTECLNYKTKSKQTWPPLFLMAPTIVKWKKEKRGNHWRFVRKKHLVVPHSIIPLCEMGRLKSAVSFRFSNSLLPLKIHGLGTSVARTKHSNCFWKERFASGKCAVSLIANVVDCEENERMTYDMTC